MEICFWCGDPKHPNLTQDATADKPDKFKLARIGFRSGFRSDIDYFKSYEPCDRCKDMFAKGIQVIEISREPFDDGRPPILDSGTTTFYPTGRTALILNGSDIANEITEQSAETSFIFVDPKDMMLLSPYFYKGDEPI